MGTLVLQDGSVIKGKSFGALGFKEGEVVFNTSMMGYQGILSDPASAKQIIVMTYPEIGNVGINDFDFESDSMQVAGVIVKKSCKTESHYKSRESFSNYLKTNKIVALEGIDTRELTKKLREVGTMMAYITSEELDEGEIREVIKNLQFAKIKEDVLLEVSTIGRYVYNLQGKINVALIDYGVTKTMLNSLAKRDCKITVYPSSVMTKEIIENNYDALFLSNGPANPSDMSFQITQIKQIMGKLPIFALGLGANVAALASGALVNKMKTGHRGSNHPVINLENKKVMTVYQNHGYTVDIENMAKIMRATYQNLNDKTLEGFEINSLNVYAVQFYPEANGIQDDSSKIYDEWINIIKRKNGKFCEVEDER